MSGIARNKSKLLQKIKLLMQSQCTGWAKNVAYF